MRQKLLRHTRILNGVILLTNLHIRAISFNLTQLMSDSYSTSHCFLSFFPAVTYKHNFFTFPADDIFQKAECKNRSSSCLWKDDKLLFGHQFVVFIHFCRLHEIFFVWQCLSVSWCATVLNVLNAVNIITIIPSKSNFSIVVIHLHVCTAALKFYRHLP